MENCNSCSTCGNSVLQTPGPQGNGILTIVLLPGTSNLLITYTNGQTTTITIPTIQGRSITGSEIIGNDLIIHYSDGPDDTTPLPAYPVYSLPTTPVNIVEITTGMDIKEIVDKVIDFSSDKVVKKNDLVQGDKHHMPLNNYAENVITKTNVPATTNIELQPNTYFVDGHNIDKAEEVIILDDNKDNYIALNPETEEFVVISQTIGLPQPVANVKIGDSYGGGVVGYILKPTDPGYDKDKVQGLIISASDQSIGCAFSNVVNLLAGTNPEIGTGMANTLAIVGQVGHVSSAAKLCNDLVEGGYSDWYLPSRYELYELWKNKDLIGIFDNYYYHSSTEFSATEAWVRDFSDNDAEGYTDKIQPGDAVRAIRSFSFDRGQLIAKVNVTGGVIGSIIQLVDNYPVVTQMVNDLAITTAKLAANAVTFAKLQNIPKCNVIVGNAINIASLINMIKIGPGTSDTEYSFLVYDAVNDKMLSPLLKIGDIEAKKDSISPNDIFYLYIYPKTVRPEHFKVVDHAGNDVNVVKGDLYFAYNDQGINPRTTIFERISHPGVDGYVLTSTVDSYQWEPLFVS